MGQPLDSSFLGGAACISERLAADGSGGAAVPSWFVRVWEAQAPSVIQLLPADHTGALGNFTGQRGTSLWGVVRPARRGSVAASPEGSYWA